MLKINKNKVLVQIGTYNGCNKDDGFVEIIKQSSPSKVILVEPNAELNDLIWKNYEAIDNIFLENVAIVKEENKGVVQLVYPKNNSGGVSANGIHYGEHNFSLVPMDDWGNDLEVLETPSITFNELCEKYELTNIHYLQIDTEGYDAEIIRSIDFDKVNIDIIKYEYWPFDEKCFERHGEDAKLYGVSGMKAVEVLLTSLGYDVTKDGQNDMIAVKNNYHE